jgi:hypothetical protein
MDALYNPFDRDSGYLGDVGGLCVATPVCSWFNAVRFAHASCNRLGFQHSAIVRTLVSLLVDQAEGTIELDRSNVTEFRIALAEPK